MTLVAPRTAKTIEQVDADCRAELVAEFAALTGYSMEAALEVTAAMSSADVQEQVYMIREANGEEV